MSLSANELDLKVCEYIKQYELGPIWPHLELLAEGQRKEVADDNQVANRYYQWLACLVRATAPKQIVELGAAAGISTMLMALELPHDGKLISVDNDPEAWRWMKGDWPNVVKVFGNDLDLGIYGDEDLSKTDIWFIDTIHEADQLRKELALYPRFFKPGAIVVLDDIHLNDGMSEVWDSIPYDKYDTTFPNHYSGFGHFIV